MTNNGKIFIFMVLAVAFVLNVVAFNYHTLAHEYVVHILYVLIIIGIIWIRRLALPVLFGLIITHVALDWISIGSIPTEAIIDSIIQIVVSAVLLIIVLNREKKSRRLEDVINATNVGTWEWNLRTNSVRINSYFAEMLGYEKHELEPFSLDVWGTLVHPDDIEDSVKALDEMRHNQRDFYEMDLRLKHKDSHYVWIHDRGSITKWSSATNPLIMSGTHTDISARKDLVKKERYYKELMEYIIDYTNSGIAMHDKDLNYIFVSQKYLDQYHLKKEDIIGKHHYDVFPDLPDRWKDVHKRVLNGEVVREDRDAFERADGHVDWTRWECRPWYDEHHKIGGIIIYTEVINDLVNKEQALQQSKNRLQAVMDNLPIGIAVNTVIPDVDFEYMNTNFAQIYGTSKEALSKGESFWDTVYTDVITRNEIKKQVEQDIASHDLTKMEWHDVPITHPNKDTRYITAYNTPLENEGMFISTVIDVTKRKQLENTLEETIRKLFLQKEEIEATLLAIGDAVISTDAKGLINNFNDIAASLTGYTKAEAIGRNFDDIFVIKNEVTNASLPSPVQQVMKTQSVVELGNHTALIDKDNNKHIIEDSASPIKNKNGELTGVILVFRDVTEKKEKEKEIEYLSLHDHLTGLYNRRFFAGELARIDKENHYPIAVFMIDLNGLKILNDAYGHKIGDEALCTISNTLNDVIGKRGVVSRIGGDEFSILLSNVNETEILEINTTIKEKVGTLVINNAPLSIAIGYAIKTSKNQTIADILKDAENMMYKMKLVRGVSARNNTIQAILKTLTDKYALERTHSERVSNICYLIGQQLDLSDDALEELKLSGMFHDIGKISLPDKLLNKPGSLTADEYSIVKEHTANGYQILRAADEYSDFAEHALYHHEKYDGTGYPKGLKGNKIPLFARIISVADAYEAMTSTRPYRKAMKKEDALQELKDYTGTQFDPAIVDAFLTVYSHHKASL